MKQKRLRTYFKITSLLICIFIIVNSCQEDDTVYEKTNSNLEPVVKTLSYDDVGETFVRLKTDLKIEKNLEHSFNRNLLSKSMDTLGLTLDTDVIKEVTIGDYTSYTMRIMDIDSLVFYNLTIEEKNGEYNMFATKYEPTQEWLNDQTQLYVGTMSSRKVNTLTQYTEPDEIFDETIGGGGLGNPDNYGVGGGGSYFDEYSVHYPHNCEGLVLIDYRETAITCSCPPDHQPDEIDYCNCDDYGGTLPRIEILPFYACDEFSDPVNIDDPYDPPYDNGGGGGGSFNDPSESPSITVTITPEECDGNLEGDLDGDCAISEYERCLHENYPDSVCICVNQGSNIADCLDNACDKLKAITDIPLVKTRLNILRQSTNLDFEKGMRISRNPTNNNYVPSDIVESINDCDAVRISTNEFVEIIIHTHPACVGYEMFSGPDILIMAQIAGKVNNSTETTVQQDQITQIILFDSRIYALKFDNPSTIQALIDILNDKKRRKDFERDLLDSYNNDVNSMTFQNETTIFKQQEHLFEHLENYNLNMSIYEGIYDDNNEVSEWKKINKDNLEQQDCN
jgi:hypothetical protein